jgi:hypothetical protein
MKDNQSSPLDRCGEAFSINTSQKNPSSQKSTIKANKGHESAFDLKMKGRPSGHHRQQSKSMLESKQKSSVNLSHKMQSTSVIREEGSRMSASSKSKHSFLKRVDNQEEEESFSQILANEVSLAQSRKEKENLISMEGSCFIEMVSTLREIRDISKESLITKKKLVKLLEDRNQVSFLYDKEDRSDVKPHNKSHKNGRKSIRRNNEKSTIKKLGKSIILEERLVKVEERLRALSRKVDEDLQSKKASTIGLGRTTKKSTSALR